MTRPSSRRPYVPVRLDQDLLDWIDRLAAARHTTRSQQIRDVLYQAKDGTYDAVPRAAASR